MSEPAARQRLWQSPWIRIVVMSAIILGSMQVIQYAGRQLGITRSAAGGVLIYLLMASTALAMYLSLVQRMERRLPLELSPLRAGRELFAGIGLGALLISLVMLVLWLAGAVRLSWNGRVALALWSGAGAALSVATIEELLMRGVVFRIIAEHLHWRIALLISALLFGGLHAFNANATLTGCLAIALTGGVLLAAAFLYTRRLWLPIGVHLGWNFFTGSFYGAGLSGTRVPSLLNSEFSGREWLTGGSFGPEASLVSVLVCGSAALLLLRRTPNRLKRPGVHSTE